jgi:ribose transport system substrate-binding protein
MRRIAALCLLLAAAWLAGCGKGTDGGTPANKGKDGAARRTIGVSVLTMTNPFFKVIADTITSEAGKHGYEVLVVDPNEDPPRQQNQVKDFIVKKVDAIVLCPCDSKAIGPAIKEANDAGIPVFTADIACLAPGAKVVCHVATDNYGGGYKAAEAIIELVGEAGGKVQVLGYPAVESCILRVKGFTEVIEQHNRSGKGGKIEIVPELNGGGSRDKGQQAAQDALVRHRDLRAIFAINDPSALGARVAVEQAKKTEQVKIVGFDGQPEGKEAIRDGKIYADPIQFPDKIGRETVKAIVGYFAGEDVPREILIPTALYRKADAVKELK